MTTTAANILLAIFYNGEACSPDELPGETDATAPSYYATPKAAKVAGAALLARHPAAEGYWVRRVKQGRARTVATFVVTTATRVQPAKDAAQAAGVSDPRRVSTLRLSGSDAAELLAPAGGLGWAVRISTRPTTAAPAEVVKLLECGTDEAWACVVFSHAAIGPDAPWHAAREPLDRTACQFEREQLDRTAAVLFADVRRM